MGSFQGDEAIAGEATAERREFARHAVNVPARLAGPGGDGVVCVIRDFCLGGMFVAATDGGPGLPELAPGAPVTISFESGLDDRGYLLEGRVARAAPTGFGLSFRDQGLLALAALSNLTEAAVVEAPRPRDDAAFAKLKVLVQAALERHLPALADAVLGRCEDDLFAAAEGARDNGRQRQLLDATAMLRRSAPALRARVLATLPAGLDQLGRFALAPGERRDERSIPGLTLVDTTEFEDFLAVNEMIVRLTNRLAAVLDSVAGRFSALLTEPIADHANPVGVTAHVHAFHGALGELGLEPAAAMQAYRSVEAVLGDRLAPFYRDLDGALEAAGFRRAEKPAPAIVKRPDRLRPGVERGDAGGVAAGSGGDTAPPGGPGGGAADAYQAAQQLLALRRMPPRLDAPRSPNPAAAEDRRRVVEALDRLQRSPGGSAGGTRERLEQALAAGGGELDPDQADLVELMDEVVTAVGRDPRASPALRRRLDALAAPLHKAAFLDPKLLSDGGHPVRRLVDGVGRLDDELEVAGTTMGERLDAIVERVRAEFGEDFRPFQTAADEVEALAEHQDEAYRENLAKVVADSEAKARLIAERHGSGAGDALKRLPPGLGEYAGLMARLAPGAGLLMKDAAGQDVEARLAWVDPRHRSYVLVDRNGRRFAEVSAQELVLQLRRRTATLIPDPHTPLFDGALYAVMHRMHEEIRRQASRDPLTGLANPPLFREELAHALVQTTHGGREFVVIHVNLDRFQLINDAAGREAGDALLQAVARVLEGVAGLRIAARVGGDEFALLLEDCSLDIAEERAEGLRQSIAALDAGTGDSGIPVTASLGLVALAAGGDVEVLERASLSACRTAKERGRNRIHSAPAHSMVTSQRDDMIHWMSTLYQLIGQRSDSLRLHRIAPLSPQATPHVHYEVLLGFRDGEGRLLRPDKLVAAAEYYDQSRHLDRWVLRTAIAWFGARPRLLDSINGFAVNLSGRSVTDETLAGDVERLLEGSGVAPTSLIFEITETAAVDNFTVAARFIEDMTALGCRFALDDFGAGHSGFTYLRRLPVDYVKIDGAFVRDMVASPGDEAVVRSVNEVAHFMGAETIAEYVENDPTIERLRAIGVDYGQGWGIEKPRFLDEWEA